MRHWCLNRVDVGVVVKVVECHAGLPVVCYSFRVVIKWLLADEG